MTDIIPMNRQSLDTHTLGSLERILFENEADSSKAELDEEIKEIQELFVRTKKHTIQLMDEMDSEINADPSRPQRMNTASTPKRRVSPIYVSSQLGNLISLKNLKMSMLKHKADLHDTVLDRAYKIITQINREKIAAGAGGDVPFDKILNFLLEAGIAIPTNLIDKVVGSDNDDNSEEDTDAALMAIINENGIEGIHLDGTGNPITEEAYIAALAAVRIETEDVPEEDVEETEDLSTAVKVYIDNSEGKIYIVNEDYEVLKEIENEDELDHEEIEEGVYFSNAFQLPIEISEDEEES